jgi:hypothetical protein
LLCAAERKRVVQHPGDASSGRGGALTADRRFVSKQEPGDDCDCDVLSRLSIWESGRAARESDDRFTYTAELTSTRSLEDVPRPSLLHSQRPTLGTATALALARGEQEEAGSVPAECRSTTEVATTSTAEPPGEAAASGQDGPRSPGGGRVTRSGAKE